MTAADAAALPMAERVGTRGSSDLGDRLFRHATRLFAALVLLLLGGIIALLVVGAWPTFEKFGLGFVVTTSWNPVTENFGGLVPIYGTLVTSFIALLIGTPISFGIALFLTELSPPWLKRPIGTSVELLAAVPSIIYGMWGLFVVAPFLASTVQPFLIDLLGEAAIIGPLFRGPPFGIGLLTAGLILSLMVLPFMAAVMRDVFDTVPPIVKESAYGLGATTWEVMWKIVVPYTRVSVVGGIMLGLGRALGETMAVTFVIGNAHRISTSLFAPGSTIASALANEFTEAVGDLYVSSLIALGLILFVITFIVLAAAKLMLQRLAKQTAGGAKR
ncbi:MAG: phosphate ABC transporter permease subunit PstC [Proteobacteria bacterium]|nr:phosphate ABC transporter permease subunit PstC [Pseudomonadota bacterium]MBI3499284.1 phosphate ABC transporter permease subunit PstC [Pseudomonadota bacterium]